MTPLTTSLIPSLSMNVDDRTRHITLATISPDGVDELGTFASVADAWMAVDALDLAAGD
jgi:hypothetical protein